MSNVIVAQHYRGFSEQLMFEWSLETPTVFNKFKRGSLDFYMSVKFKRMSDLSLNEVIRLGQIEDLHKTAFKRPRYR